MSAAFYHAPIPCNPEYVGRNGRRVKCCNPQCGKVETIRGNGLGKWRFWFRSPEFIMFWACDTKCDIATRRYSLAADYEVPANAS